MFNIVIFGPPGSGKGTQSAHIINEYNLVHLSTGDVLRAEVESGSELGVEIASRIDKGNFVSDEMIQTMVKRFIHEHKDQGSGFILDGFPRTTSQAQWLDDQLAAINEELTVFLSLEVHEEELKKRILKRSKYSGREDDKDPEIIKTRINVYHEKTKPVIDYYTRQNKFYEVNGSGTQEEIFTNIKSLINKIKK